MKVSDLIREDSRKYRRPVFVEGYLISSSIITYVVDSDEEAQSGTPHFGMILSRGAISQLYAQPIAPLGGTFVSLVGAIRLKGTLTPSGLSLLPIYMPYVYEYSFIDKGDKVEYQFKNSDVFRDVYLKRPAGISAKALQAIQSCVGKNLTIIQTKTLVLSQMETLVGQHIEGDQYDELIGILEENSLEYRVEECGIGLGGQP